MKFENISGIVFDLDGTLTDYEAGSEAGLRAALDVFNGNRERPLDWETFHAAYTAVIDAESVWSSRSGLLSTARENRIRRFRMLLQGLGLPYGSLLSEMAEAYGEGRSTGTHLFPDVIQTLKHLKKNYSLAILTEGSEKNQMDQLEQLEIDSYFSTIIISGQTPWHKPDVTLFHFTALKMEIEPQNILMVGDRLDWDVKPAKEVGMKTVHVNRSQTDQPAGTDDISPDTTIRELTELLSML